MTPHPAYRRKKLIEFALPLIEINDEAASRNTKAPKGWPTTFHKWWSPKPLAIARAVILAQLIDDPSERVDLYPTIGEQESERSRLLRLIAEISKWSATTDTKLLREAKDLILISSCHELDEINCSLPVFLDPFAGSGSIPISAQFLGLETLAGDLNPISFLICKGLIEGPSQDFSSLKTSIRVNECIDNLREPDSKEILASLFEFYADIVKQIVYAEVHNLYPGVEKDYTKRKASIAAYFWAWAVRSPNPAFHDAWTPLVSTFVVCNRKGGEVSIVPMVNGNEITYTIREGLWDGYEKAPSGTKLGRGGNFRCLLSGDTIDSAYVKKEGSNGQMKQVLMAVAVDENGKRSYRQADKSMLPSVDSGYRVISNDIELPYNPRSFWSTPYGLDSFGKLFTRRQYTFLSCFAEAIGNVTKLAVDDFVKAGSDVEVAEEASKYLGIYLTALLDRLVNYNSCLNGWLPKDNAIGPAMPRQTIAMSWGFCEANPFGKTSGGINACASVIAACIRSATPNAPGMAVARPAQSFAADKPLYLISTDPPYYDNIPYACLSDFFYLWARKVLKNIFPAEFSTVAVPKKDEVIADPYRADGKHESEIHFLEMMSDSLASIIDRLDPRYPLTLYYAFKQTESDGDSGSRITGWERFLQAVFEAGLCVTATWPLRTERKGRMLASGTNALASSILLCCCKRTENKTLSRKDFRRRLSADLPNALRIIESSGVAPVDLFQVAIGKGIEIYSSYSAILTHNDARMTVREALADIAQLLDELLESQSDSYDKESSFVLAFYEEYAYEPRPYGDAESIAIARNISVESIAKFGIIKSASGKVSIVRRSELDRDWSPLKDKRLCLWEAIQYLIRTLECNGEGPAAELLSQLRQVPGQSDLSAKCLSLAYRLYNHCEKKKQAEEARAYNGLVIAWPELEKRAAAASSSSTAPLQTTLI
jgi:putative DNA methylase